MLITALRTISRYFMCDCEKQRKMTCNCRSERHLYPECRGIHFTPCVIDLAGMSRGRMPLSVLDGHVQLVRLSALREH